MNYQPSQVISIGSQKLFDLGQIMRFRIEKVLPVKGAQFQFGIRDKILKSCKSKWLEVIFTQYPGISFFYNPIRWMSLGKVKKQEGYFKGNPMKGFWYKVGFNDRLIKDEVTEVVVTKKFF